MKKNSRHSMWLGLMLGTILAALPAFAADYTEKFEKSYPVSANASVSLSNVNGAVEIAGWDRNEVHIVATKHADTQEKLAHLQINVNAAADSVSIKTDLPSGNNPGSVDYVINVPRGARLDKISTVNGKVEISSISNVVKVSSVNGRVTGRGLSGDIELSTTNGKVDCEAIDLAKAHSVKLSTVNGAVEFSVPRDASAHLKASTVHGRISSDMNLPIKNGFVGSNLDTTLGSGEASVHLETVNGSISIHSGSKGL